MTSAAKRPFLRPLNGVSAASADKHETLREAESGFSSGGVALRVRTQGNQSTPYLALFSIVRLFIRTQCPLCFVTLIQAFVIANPERNVSKSQCRSFTPISALIAPFMPTEKPI
jgi:hypothetical protein